MKEVDPRRLPILPEFEVGRHRPGRQQGDDAPGELAGQGRQQDRLGGQEPGEREDADLDPQGRQDRQEVDGRGQGQLRCAQLVDDQEVRMEEPPEQVPAVTGLEGVAGHQVPPGRQRAGEREAGGDQGPAAGRDRVAGEPDRDGADRRQQDRERQPGEPQLVHQNSSPVGAGTSIRSDSREPAARQEVRPGAFPTVAPAEGGDEGPNDEPIERLVELAPQQARPVEPPADPDGEEPLQEALAVVEVAADGVLEDVVVVQQRRRPEQLEGPQAGVADDVDQRDVAEPEADLGRDQPDLRQRGEGHRPLGVGLGPDRDGRQHGRRQPDRHDRTAQPDGELEDRADPQQQEGPEVDRQRPVEDGAGGRRPLHRPRQPARERHQRRLAGAGDQQ